MHWLYRYIFRGIEILFLIGMITLLILAIGSQKNRSKSRPATPNGHHRAGLNHFEQQG